MAISTILTDTCLAPSADDIPCSAFRAAEKLVVDALGCALAGRGAPGIGEAAGLVKEWGGKSEASVLFSQSSVPLPNAAFANSAMIHALDLDDVYIPGIIHITSVVIPPALGCSELYGSTGKEFLAAVIMGIEAAGRISAAESGHRRSIGFLPTTLAGGFGAVIACARLMGLDADRCVNALGINYAQCAGNRQALLDQTLTKRIQPAFAARSAVWAADLADRGITGPANAFEGNAGYFKLYMNGTVPDGELFRADLEKPAVELVSLKRYPSCGACHHVQTAAEKLRSEESLDPEEIERVEIFGCGPGGLVGNPFYLGDTPQVNVQFSAAWGVAHALLRGEARIGDYTEESIRGDTQVIECARNITYTEIPEQVPQSEELPCGYPGGHARPQGIIVHTKDGRKLTRHQYPHDTFPPGGMDMDRTIQKFMDCAAFSGLCSEEQAERIVESVLDLRETGGTESLISLVS